MNLPDYGPTCKLSHGNLVEKTTARIDYPFTFMSKQPNLLVVIISRDLSWSKHAENIEKMAA